MRRTALFGFLLCAICAEPATAQALRLTSTTGASRYPSWHPDGVRIAFESDRNGTWDIFVLDSETGHTTALVQNSASDRYPAWSPDGRHLVFTSDREGDRQLYALEVATGVERRLTDASGEVLVPGWSPDGSSVSYSLREGDQFRLVSFELESRRSEVLLDPPGRDVWPRWSPDGSRLAFFSRRDTNGADDEIYVWNPRRSELVRITSKAGHDFCPAWDHSGERLVFVSVQPNGSRALRIVDSTDGTTLDEVGGGYHRVTEPSWSPDGSRIAYAAVTNPGEPYALYVVSVR